MASTEIRYAVHPTHRPNERLPSGTPVAVGYDVYAIAGHDADGAEVFLWLTPLGWSRTLEGARGLIDALRAEDAP